MVAGAQSSPQPPSIDTYFGCSDVVALVLVEGAQYSTSGTIYQARVITSFKGATENQPIYFIGHPGGKVGGGLLLFLQKSPLDVAKYVASALPDPTHNIFRDVHEPIHAGIQNGNAILECESPDWLITTADVPAGKLWVHVPIAAIGVPTSLLTNAVNQQGRPGSIAEVAQYRWIPMEEMLTYLGAAAKRNLTCPAGSGLRMGEAPMAQTGQGTQPQSSQQPVPQQPPQGAAQQGSAPSASAQTAQASPEMTPDGAMVVHSLEALPPLIRSALVSHLYDRMGDSAIKNVAIQGILIYDSAASVARGMKHVRAYVMKGLYVDSTTGILGLPISVGLNSGGKVVDPIQFPDMAHNPAKRKIVPAKDAFATAAKHIKEGVPLPSYMEYEPAVGSLLWKFRWSNPKNDAMYQEVDVDAHTGKYLQMFLHNKPSE